MSPLVACPDCGREVSDAAPACPQCGRPMAATATQTARTTNVAAGRLALGKSIAFLALLFGTGLALFGSFGAGMILIAAGAVLGLVIAFA